MKIEEQLLARFPKTRRALPQEYQKIYTEHYLRNRGGTTPATSLAKRMEAWMHRKVAQDVAERPARYKTLEIGAGNLNHLEYEPSSKQYDIVEPFDDLYANSPHRSRIDKIYQNVHEITNSRYDRIVSIATFEHICDLPSVIGKSGLLLEPQGRLRVAIPSEGTLLWALGWKLTTGIEFRLRHHLDYGVLMRYEHVNSAKDVANTLRYFFNSVRQSVFGITPSLSIYQFLECAVPDLQRCARYSSQVAPGL
jgi:hypothetical protein